MQVQVNASSAAKSVLEFVKAAGGQAKHTEAMELVARICGFASYRAMRAVAQRNAETPPSGLLLAASQLVDAGHVVFRSSLVDWQFAEEPDASLADIPARRRNEFEIVVEDYKPQFRVSVRPAGSTVASIPGKAVLDVQIEVNDGLPCLRLFNDSLGDTLLTVFGSGEGLVLREDEGKVLAIGDAPAALQEIAARNGSSAGAVARAVVHASASTAPTRRLPQTPPVAFVGRDVSISGEEAAVFLTNPRDASLAGHVIHAKFDDCAGEMQAWLDVSLVAPDGSADLADNAGGYTVFGVDPDDAEDKQAFVNELAHVAAYFVSQDQFQYMRELVSELIVRPNALDLVRKCLDIVTRAPSVHLACDAVEALLAVMPEGLVMSGGSEDGVTCRHCHRHYSLDDEGIGLGEPCPSFKCPSHQHAAK